MKDSRLVDSQQQYFNKRFGFYYYKFFNESKDYLYIFFENINFKFKDQITLLNQIKHLCIYCKVKKKVLRVLFRDLNIDLYSFFLFNPIILKIHKSNLNEFIVLITPILNNLQLFKKKEKCFFDFSIMIYEMRLLYYFNDFLKNYNNINYFIKLYVNIYKYVNFSIITMLYPIFQLLFLLNIIYVKKQCRLIIN